ncbi:MAG: flagellar hook-basal body protein [Planctomycetaceae bacterium]
MLYGLYLSAQGADVQSRRLDVVANNIANAQTDGFKRDLAIFQAHEPRDVIDGRVGDLPGHPQAHTGGTTFASVVTDFSQGALIPTGGAYDVALAGPGFFRVAGKGEQFLTRTGKFTVDRRGELVTQSTGSAVLGQGGRRIRIPVDATRVDIDDAGNMRAIAPDGSGTAVGRLDVVIPESSAKLEKVADGYYRNSGRQRSVPAGTTEVKQGYVEGSGVRPVLEMLDMIEASRGFETNVNMIRTQDEALGNLLQAATRR